MSNQRNRTKLVRVASTVLVFGLTEVADAGTTIYVNGACGNDSWTGSTPECVGPDGPKAHIQVAIEAAVDGDEVVIAPGTYTGLQNRNLDFQGKAITVRSSSPNDPDAVASTIIDCELEGRAFVLQSGETPASVIDGLTVIRGLAQHGPAVYLSNSSSVTLRRSVFRGHAVGFANGVVFSDNTPVEHGNLVIDRCSITDNLGGAVGLFFLDTLTIIGSDISRNGGDGVSSSPYGPTNSVIRDSTFRHNEGSGIGVASRDLEISGCLVSNNLRGGLSLDGAFGEGLTLVENCIITGNSAPERTGGAFISASSVAIIRNCLIAGNTGKSSGGLEIAGFGEFDISGLTIANNVATTFGGGGIRAFGTDPTVIRNTILWGNTATEGAQLLLASGFNNPAIVTVEYSIVEGGERGVSVDNEGCCSPSQLMWSIGNSDVDPQFVNAAGGDYHVLNTSQSIDGGDREFVPDMGELDLEGHARVLCTAVDAGAFEFGIGDGDCDRDVDLADVAAFEDCVTGPGGTADPDQCAPFDFAADGAVDFADFFGLQRVFTGSP